jgi:hypothetical protein
MLLWERMGDTGTEHTQKMPVIRYESRLGAPKSAPFEIDSDLQRIVNAWPALSGQVKADVLRIVARAKP